MHSTKLAILGCGNMARHHAQHILNHTGAELVALCDTTREICESFRKSLDDPQSRSIPCFDNPVDMYQQRQPDGVVIVTPHTLHYEHGVQALEAGCHVLMEKPMVTSVEHAELLKDKAESLNKTLMVGFMTSYTPPFHALREIIRSERLGKLELVNGYLSQDWMNFTTGMWRQNPELSGGGQAYDSGAHIMNSLVWSVESPVDEVFAFIDNHGTRVDINSVINVRFTSGVLASLCISGNCVSAGSHMVFILEKGRVEIDGWVGSWIKAFDSNGEMELELPQDINGPVDNFIEVIQGRAEPCTRPINGIHHSQLMDAIYASASSGQKVSASSFAMAGS